MINWDGDKLRIPIADNIDLQRLEPLYPPVLKISQIHSMVREGVHQIREEIRAAKKIVLLLEDSSRATVTADLVEVLLRILHQIRGGEGGLNLIIAAGAHYNLAQKDLTKKVRGTTYQVHNAIDQGNLVEVGRSNTGIPLVFNKKVVEADLRLSVSTVNIHPLAGFSGGGKILLPGVAGLKTIFAFHALPRGTAGIYKNTMRSLINEAAEFLPISFSWQLLANPKGRIVTIIGGSLFDAHQQAIALLEQMVTVVEPEEAADLVLAGCQPFNLNLLSAFKALPQLPGLLRKSGRLVLFNEAYQGPGAHHWRNKPEVVKEQRDYYHSIFHHHQVGVYSPGIKKEVFSYLFPENFQLIENTPNLLAFIQSPKPLRILILPYAPVTLVKPN